MTGRTVSPTTTRIINLPVGKSTVVPTRHAVAWAREQYPDRRWKSEATEGGFIVTRTA